MTITLSFKQIGLGLCLVLATTVLFGLTQVYAQTDPTNISDEFAQEMRSHFGQSLSESDIRNATTQLGCSDFETCKAICEADIMREQCASWAEEAGIIDSARANRIRRFLLSTERPGSCSSVSECRDYCKDNREECQTFIEENDLMDIGRLQRFKSFHEATDRPAACTNLISCRNYCSNERNTDECADFLEENGLANSERISAFRAFHLSSNRPGACKDVSTCRSYCEDEEHANECMDFAEKFNLISRSNLIRLRAFYADSEKPGNCTTRRECQAYCNDSEHAEECADFAERNKLEDIDRLAKFRAFHATKARPGGCNSIEGCREYCSLAVNLDECDRLVSEIEVPIEDILPTGEGTDLVLPPDRQNIIQDDLGEASHLRALEGECSNKVECNQYCVQNRENENCRRYIESIQKDLQNLQELNQLDIGQLQQQLESLRQQQGISTNQFNDIPPINPVQ